MKETGIRIEKGIIVLFNSITLWGVIALCSGKEIEFHSTCFQSAPPTRFPKLGEMVQITFSCGELVFVRSV